jgi:hypothetical protein
MKKYILSLRSKFKKQNIFLKWTPKNIKSNAFSILVSHLWFANTNIQFILDPYAVATYCTSNMTKIDKSITLELHSIIKKCIANIRIQKLAYVFFNAQQMVVQLVYLMLSLPLYHSFWTFQFISSSLSEKFTFVLKS